MSTSDTSSTPVQTDTKQSGPNQPAVKSSSQKGLVVVIIAFLLVFVLALAGVLAYVLLKDDSNEKDSDNDSTSDITSFEECEAAGYPVMESYPRQCAVPGGNTYTEVIDEVDIEDDATTDDSSDTDSTGDGETATETTIKVYFSKDPDSTNDFSKVFGVNRSSDRTDIGTFAIEQLIAGPSATEEAAGYFTALELSGSSNCSGKDFSLNVDKTAKIATLKFCKTVMTSGLGDDARVTQSIEATLIQFSTVDEVIILTKDGNCFGDESGMNICLD